MAIADPAAHQTIPQARERYDVTFHFAPEGERRQVPFERIAGLIAFRAIVQGREAWAVLDNGQEFSAIDLSFARQAGLHPNAVTGTVRSAYGTAERHTVADVDITISNMVQYRARLSGTDLSYISRVAGRPISLIIGREMFSAMTFVIYSSRNVFEFSPSGTMTAPAGTPFVSLADSLGRVAMEIGGQPLTLTVDLGYNGQINLTPDAWLRSRLDRLPHTSGFGADMLGNRFEVHSVRLPQLDIGPFRRTDVSVDRGMVVPANRDGMIGIGYLSAFDFALDLKTQRLWFIRNAVQAPTRLTPRPQAAAR